MPTQEPQPSSVSDWWTQVNITELFALVSGASFLCGIAYNAAYFSVLEPRLFSLLDFWDQIKAALGFLPFVILPVILPLIIRVPGRRPPPDWVVKLRPRLGTERTRIVIVALLVFICLTSPAIIQLLGTAVALFWWGFDGVPTVLPYIRKRFPRWAVFGILFMPVVIFGSVWLGFGSGLAATTDRQKPSFIQLKERSPEREAVLLRVLDDGVLMYNRASNHLVFYRWEQIERLETRRRRLFPW